MAKTKTGNSSFAKNKLFSTFLCLCVGAASIQTTFYIPVFSDIFSPETTVPIPVPTPGEMTFDFVTFSATDGSVSFALNVENEPDDFSIQNAAVFLVKQDDATDAFFASVSEDVKNKNKIKVLSKVTTGTFSKCLTEKGWDNLKEASNYALVVVKNEKVVKTQNITTKKSMAYTLSEVKTTSNSVSFTLTIENGPESFDSENIYVYLVESKNGTTSFLKSVESSIKNIGRITVSSKITNQTFSNYMTSTNWSAVKPNTDYELVVAKNDTVVQKVDVKTKSDAYIEGINQRTSADDEHGTQKYLEIQPVVNSDFTDFTVLFVEFEDTSTHKIKFQTTMDKDGVESGGWWNYTKLKTDSVETFKISIFCATEHPQNINYIASKVVDHTTYYLIYVYEKTISF